jgi:hypothetical protein
MRLQMGQLMKKGYQKGVRIQVAVNRNTVANPTALLRWAVITLFGLAGLSDYQLKGMRRQQCSYFICSSHWQVGL